MMTPERAAEVSKKQSQFPFWGNYRKFMTQEEIDHVHDLFMRANSGNVSFASIVEAIKNGVEIPLKQETST